MKVGKLIKRYCYGRSNNKIVIVDAKRSNYNQEILLFSGLSKDIYNIYPDLLKLKVITFYQEGLTLVIRARSNI